ncbi:hypothetical protein ABKN59_011988 [Abortiporus biennis]
MLNIHIRGLAGLYIFEFVAYSCLCGHFQAQSWQQFVVYSIVASKSPISRTRSTLRVECAMVPWWRMLRIPKSTNNVFVGTASGTTM